MMREGDWGLFKKLFPIFWAVGMVAYLYGWVDYYILSEQRVGWNSWLLLAAAERHRSRSACRPRCWLRCVLLGSASWPGRRPLRLRNCEVEGEVYQCGAGIRVLLCLAPPQRIIRSRNSANLE